MRSRIVAVLALLLVAVGFAFAGGQGEAAASGEPVEVQIWLPGGAQDDQATVNAAAAEYAGPKIGVVPNLQFFGWGEYTDKKQLAIQSGEEMDLVFTASWNNYFQEVERNAWLPLDDLIDEHAPAIRDVVGFFLEGPVKDGQLYAVPTVKEGAESGQWIFNQEFVDKYNVPIDEIKSAEDLEPWVALVAENEPDIIPYLIDGVSELPNRERVFYDTVGMGGNWHYYPESGEVKFIWNNERTWELAEMAREWYLAGYFPPEVEDAGAQLNVDKYWEEGSWFVYSHVGHPGKTGELAGRWGYPIIGTGPVDQPVATTEILLGAMFAISRTSQHPVESIKMLELMNVDREFGNLLNYGVEGTHWNFVDEGNGIIQTVADSGYGPNMQWALQNQFNTYLLPSEDPEKWDKYRAFNESARVSPIIGFTADQSPVRTQIAAIQNVMDQYDALIKRGLVDPDEVRDEFIAALDAAGVPEVEAEITAQVEAFLASK